MKRSGSSLSSYHREQAGSSSYSISSSSAGTIVSTAYTSSASRLSSASMSMEAAMLLDLEIHDDQKLTYTEHPEKIKRVDSMAKELISATSANRGIKGSGDMTALLERWFREMGVGWVLHLPGAASTGELNYASDARSWLLALAEITELMSYTTTLPSPLCGSASVGLPSICEKEPEVETESAKQPSRPDQLRIAQFFQQTMWKMLGFVDVMADEVLAMNALPVLHVKPSTRTRDANGVFCQLLLRTLLRVHDDLSSAFSKFDYLLRSPASADAGNIETEMSSLLFAKKDKARDVIWSTLEDTRTRILESVDDSSGAQTPQASLDIHTLTCSVMGHVAFLLDNYWTVARAVPKPDVPQIEGMIYHRPLDSMILEMTSCLEQKLVSMSKLFPEQGLRFLFLINNFDFIRQRLQFSPLNNFPDDDFFDKIEGYKDSYLQASWAPVFSCLLNPTHLCFGKNYSQLSKFESEFQKTYTTQKLLKVPDPNMRKGLRKAITTKFIPGYEKYIEDNEVTTPKFTPQELEEMLEDLFEG